MTGQQVRERIARQEGVFALAQRGERVEPLQLRIDEARMAHDHAAIRQPIEEAGEQRGEIGIVAERIGAGETRIGAQPERIGALPEILAQPIEQPGLSLRMLKARGGTRPHCRSQAPGALALATSSTASRICGNRCTC